MGAANDQGREEDGGGDDEDGGRSIYDYVQPQLQLQQGRRASSSSGSLVIVRSK